VIDRELSNMKGIKRLGLAVAAAVMAGSPATAACWSNSVVEAAYVRDFDTILMVATLRCRTKDAEMGASYNKFVREKRAVLVAANDELRAQFSEGRGAKAGLDAFDRFSTSLANSHGAGEEGVSCTDYRAMVDSAAAAPVSREALIRLAVKAGAHPDLPQAACTREVALVR
jgi:hypothetical protein